MTSTDPMQGQPPSLVSAIVLGIVRHGLTALGGMAVTAGWILPQQQNAIIADVVGIAAILVSVGWSALSKNLATKQLASAVSTISALSEPQAVGNAASLSSSQR